MEKHPHDNVIERLNGEFRRRVKTQCWLPSGDAALVLLCGLVATGQIKLRKIDGYKKLAGVISEQMRRGLMSDQHAIQRTGISRKLRPFLIPHEAGRDRITFHE